MELPCHWWYDNQPHLDSRVRLNCAFFCAFAETFFPVPLKCSHFTLLHTDASQLAPLLALRITWSIPAAKATLCWKDGRCCCDVCFQKNCSTRHDFLSLNAGVYPTRSSLQITGLQNELLAQQYDVTNLKHELVPGLRTQFFYSVCLHS